jgi:hypothetical protein
MLPVEDTTALTQSDVDHALGNNSGGNNGGSGGVVIIEGELARTLKGNAMKSLVSLLEGRQEHLVHEVLEDKLEVSLLRNRLVQSYKQFKLMEKLKEKLAPTEQSWDEIFLVGTAAIVVLENEDQRQTRGKGGEGGGGGGQEDGL